MEEPQNKPEDAGNGSATEGVGDALRAAVERTLAATADSATETRQRAQNLVDDVVRRGQVARDQVTKRGEEASNRLAEAISDLRSADGESLEELRGRIATLEARLNAMDARLEAQSNPQVQGEVHADEPHEKRDSGA
jgi:polyhydroxyalkanoate synthesis regulator phasin